MIKPIILYKYLKTDMKIPPSWKFAFKVSCKTPWLHLCSFCCFGIRRGTSLLICMCLSFYIFPYLYKTLGFLFFPCRLYTSLFLLALLFSIYNKDKKCICMSKKHTFHNFLVNQEFCCILWHIKSPEKDSYSFFIKNSC